MDVKPPADKRESRTLTPREKRAKALHETFTTVDNLPNKTYKERLSALDFRLKHLPGALCVTNHQLRAEFTPDQYKALDTLKKGVQQEIRAKQDSYNQRPWRQASESGSLGSSVYFRGNSRFHFQHNGLSEPEKAIKATIISDLHELLRMADYSPVRYVSAFRTRMEALPAKLRVPKVLINQILQSDSYILKKISQMLQERFMYRVRTITEAVLQSEMVAGTHLDRWSILQDGLKQLPPQLELTQDEIEKWLNSIHSLPERRLSLYRAAFPAPRPHLEPSPRAHIVGKYVQAGPYYDMLKLC
ncbi:hypothetical protein CYMTET_53251 [Cymbomonas tetramitiformis]|uniref:Uncharacterized protein n=1 Tax=Cymbomonas tetramitiformis TaxID=36881 RepID=A0AAE0EPX5_9CHLO|nr:hypothetical protein CYMTET_53251 [Cymbomonas tetramitiformis]